ncbi:NTP transferase domain-containing protein [Amycolatopsis sp. GM8]|uniref:phosphocholine cytidylyltransferase family protein n=1 Tax=Amycolatopsis sp. GM8 TaxID=2896530 RepID=UPI001F1F1129|nr:phosphocholine cytidylyltransferase family protein [Amycolatopsis sp. GM8]
MGPLTADRPKCLLKIGGHTLLERQAAALRMAGVDEIGIVTGWQAQQFAGMPFRLFHNADWATTSMVGSLACAEEWLLTEPLVVSYGDIVYASSTITGLLASAAPITIAYDPDWRAQWSSRFEDPLSDAETFRVEANGHLLEIGGRPRTFDEVEGQYMGLLKFTPSGWAALKRLHVTETDRQDMTGLLRRLVQTQRPAIATIKNTGPWHEFDHSSDLATGRTAINHLDRILGKS